MPRPKRIQVLTIAPPQSAAAIDEFTKGIQIFIEWANRARMGETSLPAAIEADATLTAFSEGRFDAEFKPVFSPSAVLVGCHILHLVRDGHWHPRPCLFCNRWLVPKDQRRRICRRLECVRAAKAQREAARRQALNALAGRRTKATADALKRRTF